MILKKGSFLKAAETLGYAQSTISLHIQQLEEYLGIKLFEKNGRRMVLTHEGKVFWEYASRLLDQAMELKEKTLLDISQTIQGHVRIGVIETVGKKYLPPILIEFLKENPKVTLSIEFIRTNTICDRILHEELDIGIGPILPNETTGLRKIPLFVEKVGLLFPEQHPLARKMRLTLQDLRNINLLYSEPLNSYRATLEQRFAELGVTIKPVIEIGDSDTMIQFVQGGIGVALLPVTIVQTLPAATVFREIQDVDLSLSIGLIRKEKSLGKAVTTLFAVLQEKLEKSFE